MQRTDGTYCPYIKKNCIEYKCKFFQKLRGKDPQGGEVDEYDCAILWQNVLLIENSQMQRQTGAAVESFRNEVTVQNQQLTKLLISPPPDVKVIEESK